MGSALSEITVREIAAKLQQPGEDIAKVVDRIRNWTDIGLLKTIGPKKPGTGKHRLYPEDALADALILSILADALGMQTYKGPVGRMIKILRQIPNFEINGGPSRLGSGFANLIRSATEGAGKDFLLFGLSRDGTALPEIAVMNAADLAACLGNSQHEAHVILDLGKLKKRLDGEGQPDA